MKNLRELFAGIVLVLVVGILGFLYRYEVENPKVSALGVGTSYSNAACTQEAKVCPDGSAVGRTGPNCSFAVCPPPNVELSSASTTIGFVLPPGYKQNVISSDNSNHLASYVEPNQSAAPAATTSAASVIDVYDYPIPAGQTASQVMLAQTVFMPSGQQATTTSAFKTVVEGSNTFYEALTEDLNGEVQSVYYLYEPTSVLGFVITEQGVQNWNDPNLAPDTLPQHVALQEMLATLQMGE